MKRRALLSATLLVAPVSGLVAQQRPLPRIGFMAQVPPSAALQPLLDAFISGLAENGYVVDRDVIVEYRYHGGSSERMAEQAAEFVRTGVALIVAPSTQTAIVAQRTTNKIPIVIVAAGDPVGAGLAASLARPGGNITGMSSQGVDLALKQLELLEEAIPAAKRVALLLHPENPPHVAGYAQLRVAGPAMGLKIEPIPKRVADDIEPAFQRAVELGCQAMIVFDDAVTGVHRAKLIERSITARLPAIYQWRYYVVDGGLMSFGPAFPDLFRRAASHVARILRGERPAEMPIEQPTTFELVINLKTAKALGLIIPPSILARANDVVE
jgi:putative tryptophan/tyrosine transport system substrate-binding protein